MTTANKVTIIRILLTPPFVVQLLYYFRDGNELDRLSAALIFAIAAVLDGVDGYIARRYNQRSRLGAVLDPVADKLMLVSAIMLLSLYSQTRVHMIPTWVTAVVLSKDAILLIGMAVVYYTCGKVQITTRLIGKVTTVLQMFLVLWALLKWDERWLWNLALATAVLTGVSGFLYVRDGIKQLGKSPLSLPDHRL